MNVGLVAGLDVGSTNIKILLADLTGKPVLVQQVPTPWDTGDHGTTTMSTERLTSSLVQLLKKADTELAAMFPETDVNIEAIAATGMGEAGFVVGPDGEALAPAFAWFDPRGSEQLEALPETLRDSFAAATGMPLGVQVTAAKMLVLRDAGLALGSAQFLSVPEYVVFLLGGRQVAELTLAARTGLLDVERLEPWTPMLDAIGVSQDFLPPLVRSGAYCGKCNAEWVPSAFHEAALTVAGHDHLVSMLAAGGLAEDTYQVSLGTAEVIVRTLDNPLDGPARKRLADALINCVPDVVPGRYALVAGVKSGLIMRRLMKLCGIRTKEDRRRLDDDVINMGSIETELSQQVAVTGARNDDGVLSLTVPVDGVSPSIAFQAALQHANEEIELLLEAMDAEVQPSPTGSVLTGGWTDMESVVASRAEVLPNLRISNLQQDTALGAAKVALTLFERLVDARNDDERSPSGL